MIHPPTDSQIRLTNAKDIAKGILPLFDPQRLFEFHRASGLIVSSATPTILVIQEFFMPITLRALLISTDTNPITTMTCDVLIGSDRLTDVGAALRDQRPTGLRRTVGNLWPTLTPQRIPINFPINRWHCVLKALFLQLTGVDHFIQVTAEIEKA